MTYLDRLINTFRLLGLLLWFVLGLWEPPRASRVQGVRAKNLLPLPILPPPPQSLAEGAGGRGGGGQHEFEFMAQAKVSARCPRCGLDDLSPATVENHSPHAIAVTSLAGRPRRPRLGRATWFSIDTLYLLSGLSAVGLPALLKTGACETNVHRNPLHF